MTKITKEIVELGLKEHRAIEDMVFLKKYPLDGEETLQDTKNRIARLVPEELKEFVRGDTFLPAGSVLSGALNDEVSCSLSNCYYTPIEGDSIEHIFDGIKKMARTYSYRGGTGTSISVLRPRDTKVNNAAKTSSGSVSFMPLLSEVTNTIGQNGRRGALMILQNIRHPDTLEFIWSKSKPEEIFGEDPLTGKIPDVFGANISLAITDDFMKAVEHNFDWTFSFPNREADPKKYDEEWDGQFDKWDGDWAYYKTMPAREVMRQIAESAWTSGDPGVLFIDTTKKMTPGTQIHPDLEPVGVNP